MIRVNRIIRIEWKNNPSVFELKNKEAFGTTSLRLGSSTRAVQHLLARSEELKVILPTVVGTSPNDSDWQDKVGMYLNDFFILLPRGGLTMDCGYTFDVYESRIANDLKSYEATLPKAADDNNREKYILNCIQGKLYNGKFKVSEENLYRYVTFNNPVEYINWRMCLNHGKVANSVEDIRKSTNIEFYLTSEEQILEAKRNITKLRNNAIKFYNDIISDTDISTINPYIISSGLVNSIDYYKSLNFEDKCSLLLDMCNNNPEGFLKLKEDKNLNTRSKIILYVWYGILKYLPNSTTIVDAADVEKTIGNTMEEAISYFSNDLHKAHVAEMYNRYKSLKN